MSTPLYREMGIETSVIEARSPTAMRSRARPVGRKEQPYHGAVVGSQPVAVSLLQSHRDAADARHPSAARTSHGADGLLNCLPVPHVAAES